MDTQNETSAVPGHRVGALMAVMGGFVLMVLWSIVG